MIKSVSFNDFIIFSVIILSTFLLSAIGLGRIATLFLIPLIFVWFFLSRPKISAYIIKQKSIKNYVYFFIWACVSIFYAEHTDAALVTQQKFLIVLLFSLAVMSYAIISIKNINLVYYAFIFSLIILIGFVFQSGIQLEMETRLEEGLLNANSYGYYIFNGLFSSFIIYSQLNKFKTLFLSALILLIILSFYVVIVSASRGALIILTLLVIFSFFILYYYSVKTKIKRLIVFVLFTVIGFFTISFAYSKYIKNTILMDRFFELEETEGPREFHMRKAIEIGFSNPIIGIGAGNYAKITKRIETGSFSHNTYTEIFANYGLIGLILYLSFFTVVFNKIYKTVTSKTKVKLYLILLYLILFLIYNIFYVTYLTAEFTSMLFVVFSHVLILHRTAVNSILSE